MIKLYNTLVRKVENFNPPSSHTVSLYTCGPTVYDHAHIGNLRTYVFEDTLRRVLKAGGYKVKHVMNITDVDDKTIKRSQDEFPDDKPMVALKKLTERYEQIFYDDAKQLGIDLSDSRIVKATDHIDDMQSLINDIPNRYVSDDGIYYDIAKDKDYGVLVKLDRSHEHHRIDNDEYDKDHVADFALWKKQSDGEPAWDFEIDGQNMAGRPGWHIECSAMSVKYLGQPFDIHTGGVDLIFPHHENEIAQSRAASGKDLAKFFVHAEHLLVDGKKMSKSLNNFYTLEGIKTKGFDPLALRLLFLQAHYRSQLNFTWESLGSSKSRLQSFTRFADLKWNLVKNVSALGSKQFETGDINEHLYSDLNTPLALSTAQALVDVIYDICVSDKGGLPEANQHNLETALKNLDSLFGLNLSSRKDIDEDEKRLVTEREEARKFQDWQKADELRDKLKERGIEINDTEHGPVWSRI